MKTSRIRYGIPSEDEAMELAGRLKPDDVQEIYAASGMEPETAMKAMLANGTRMTGAYVDGRLEMVFGTNQDGYEEGTAAVWMVSSDVVYRHGKTLLVHGRRWLDLQQRRYGTLFNFVDARAARTLHWLERMGFRQQVVPSFGVHGLPFVLVTRGDTNV